MPQQRLQNQQTGDFKFFGNDAAKARQIGHYKLRRDVLSCVSKVRLRAGGMAGKIFVNYRRGDSRADAARVRDRLAQTFGAPNVFMDVDNMLVGQRFDKQLEKALDQCDVFLAILGPRWMEHLTERQQTGERDYVREEIAAALKRGTLVIPVTLERTPLPREDQLPEDIRALVMHQKHDVTHESFGRDIVSLTDGIKAARKAVLQSSRPQRRFQGKILAAVLGGAAVIAMALGFGPGRLFETAPKSPSVAPAATTAPQAAAERPTAETPPAKPAVPEGQVFKTLDECKKYAIARYNITNDNFEPQMGNYFRPCWYQQAIWKSPTRSGQIMDHIIIRKRGQKIVSCFLSIDYQDKEMTCD